MATTALRYSWDHPLGTGIYRPDESHVTGNLDAGLVEEVLSAWPHNQFLSMLALFGFPGLILLILFYVLALRSLMHSLRLIVPLWNPALNFLIIGVVGALAAYSFISLFHPSGPFLEDWSHFFIIGLAFSVQRIAASYKVNQGTQQRQHGPD